MICLRKLLFVYALILSFLAVPAAYAADNGSTPEKPGSSHKWHKKAKEIYSQLNLTDQQKKQIEANKSNDKAQAKALFENIKSNRQALKQELMKPQLDMAKINDLQSQNKTLQAQMIDNRLNSILAVRNILTPEQFSKFLSLMDERHSHKGRWNKKPASGDKQKTAPKPEATPAAVTGAGK